jgi:hypothetical protein
MASHYKTPRYNLQICANFRKKAFFKSFKEHLHHILDEIELECTNKTVLKFPNLKVSYYKETGSNEKNHFRSKVSFEESLLNNFHVSTNKQTI